MNCRRTFEAIALTIGAALIIAAPALQGEYYASGEEAPFLFATLYGWTPFQPGANRNFSIMPFLAWPARSLVTAMWCQFIITVMIAALGVVAFLVRLVPRVAWSSMVILIAVMALSMMSFYQALLSPAYPHIVPLGIAMLAVAILPSPGASTTSQAALAALAMGLMFIAASMNATASMIAGGFIGMRWALCALTERRLALRENATALAVLGAAVVSVLAWGAISAAFFHRFPQSNLSLYSPTASVFDDITLSLGQAVKTYRYEIEALQSLAPRWWPLGHAVMLGTAPLAALCLWLTRKSELFPYALTGTALYFATIIVSAGISQVKHINYLESGHRARYFVGNYEALSLSLAILLSTVVAVVAGRGWRVLNPILATGAALYAITAFAWSAVHPHPSLRRPFLGDPAMIAAGRLIRERGAVATVGDFYPAWLTQYHANDGDGHTPNTVPVAIRTEAFPLRAFRLWSRTLLTSGSMLVACVRQLPLDGDHDTAPPGPCEEKFKWFIARGAFPSAPVKAVGEPINVPPLYVVSFYELGDCQGDVLFRADKTADGYAVRDGGFVVAKCKTLHENDTGPFLSRAAKLFPAPLH